jgi:hypothetical protein
MKTQTAHQLVINSAKHDLKMAGVMLEQQFEQERLALDDKPSAIVWAYCGEQREKIEAWVNVCRLKLDMAILQEKLHQAEQEHEQKSIELFRLQQKHIDDQKEKTETEAYLKLTGNLAWENRNEEVSA